MAGKSHGDRLVAAGQKLEAAFAELENCRVPEGKDFYYYSSFPAFSSSISSARRDILVNIEKLRELVSAGKPKASRNKVSEEDCDVDDLVELAGDSIDECLDSIDIALENRQRVQSTQLRAKESKSRATSQGSGVAFHLAHLPKPQTGWEVDNSNVPFVHSPAVEPPPIDNLEKDDLPRSASQSSLADSVDLEAHARVIGYSPLKPSPSRSSLGREASQQNLRGATKHPFGHVIRELNWTDIRDDHDLLSFVQEDARHAQLGCVDPSVLNCQRRLTFIDSEAELLRLGEKLKGNKELAVDLEAHNFRSFQGFVCLMQLSTRDEDFVIDTIALRRSLGRALGPVFVDKGCLKIFHGGDSDVRWLQRDFGIYVVNMFDTGRAARVLDYPSTGLAYLLKRFCDFTAQKRFQMADWRQRPIPSDMLDYARSDTKFLLPICDKLKAELLLKGGGCDEYLRLTWEKSREVSLNVYEKDLFSSKSYLSLLKGNSQGTQALSVMGTRIVQVLYKWRDSTARHEDESTGYILPNHLLLRLARVQPLTAAALAPLLQQHGHVQRHAEVLRRLIVEVKSPQQGNDKAHAEPGILPVAQTSKDDKGIADADAKPVRETDKSRLTLVTVGESSAGVLEISSQKVDDDNGHQGDAVPSQARLVPPTMARKDFKPKVRLGRKSGGDSSVLGMAMKGSQKGLGIGLRSQLEPDMPTVQKALHLRESLALPFTPVPDAELAANASEANPPPIAEEKTYEYTMPLSVKEQYSRGTSSAKEAGTSPAPNPQEIVGRLQNALADDSDDEDGQVDPLDGFGETELDGSSGHFASEGGSRDGVDDQSNKGITGFDYRKHRVAMESKDDKGLTRPKVRNQGAKGRGRARGGKRALGFDMFRIEDGGFRKVKKSKVNLLEGNKSRTF